MLSSANYFPLTISKNNGDRDRGYYVNKLNIKSVNVEIETSKWVKVVIYTNMVIFNYLNVTVTMFFYHKMVHTYFIINKINKYDILSII